MKIRTYRMICKCGVKSATLTNQDGVFEFIRTHIRECGKNMRLRIKKKKESKVFKAKRKLSMA